MMNETSKKTGKAEWKKFLRDNMRGFTLMETLVVATIVLILVGIGSVSFLEVHRRAKEHLAAERLQKLATYESLYLREFGEYAEFIDLQEQGYIDPNYVEDDNIQHTNGTAFIPDYVIEFIISGENTYTIEVTSVLDDKNDYNPRWRMTGGIKDLRGMYVDERNVVRWTENDMPVIR